MAAWCAAPAGHASHLCAVQAGQRSAPGSRCAAAGYRWLELHADGTLHTGVERVEISVRNLACYGAYRLSKNVVQRGDFLLTGPNRRRFPWKNPMHMKDDLVRHYHWLRQYGLNDSHSGNASVRDGGFSGSPRPDAVPIRSAAANWWNAVSRARWAMAPRSMPACIRRSIRPIPRSAPCCTATALFGGHDHG